MESLRKSRGKSKLVKKQIQEMEARITELEIKEREYKQASQRMKMKCKIADLLAESSSVDKIYENVIQIICENLNFEVGMCWSYESSINQLSCKKVWQLPDEQLKEFGQASWQYKFSPGVGLPGRVLVTGKPSWIVDLVKDNNFPRAFVAQKAGLQSAFSFPLLIGCKVLGTMEFFTSQCRLPDNNLLELMSDIGNQIGEFNWQNWHGKISSSIYFC
jgi:hypothetical protein